jgi:hypothetical protein
VVVEWMMMGDVSEKRRCSGWLSKSGGAQLPA